VQIVLLEEKVHSVHRYIAVLLTQLLREFHRIGSGCVDPGQQQVYCNRVG
jgi:hypothetical protein